MIDRKARLEEEFKKYIAEFIERESNRDALISITRVELNQKFTEGFVYVTVLPENKETSVIHFLTRQGAELKKHLRKSAPHLRTPFLKFVIDLGDKNRLRIDELSKQ